jgi:hypothetical protein
MDIPYGHLLYLDTDFLGIDFHILPYSPIFFQGFFPDSLTDTIKHLIISNLVTI